MKLTFITMELDIRLFLYIKKALSLITKFQIENLI